MGSKEGEMTYPFYTRDARDITVDASASVQDPDHPSGYLPDQGLVDAVNVALLLKRPLLLTGEPGTGKTQLAYSVAWQLASRKLLNLTSMRVEKFETKSSSFAKDLFYSFDTIRRFQAAHSGGSANNLDYLSYNALGRAILNALPRREVDAVIVKDFPHNGPARSVVLIDEIDKADSDFQDDMLDVLDQMQFDIIEIDKTITARNRPVIVITSNAKKDLSDPFLGRCNFHHIAFPDMGLMRLIVDVHFPNLNKELSEECIEAFYRLRDLKGIEKKPATRELINWIRALKTDSHFQMKSLSRGNIPYMGILFKKSADLTAAAQQIARMR
jgi:MoxR-like ATPase